MGSSRSVRCHLIDRSSGGGLGPAAA
jgi:hypothetical protein